MLNNNTKKSLNIDVTPRGEEQNNNISNTHQEERLNNKQLIPHKNHINRFLYNKNTTRGVSIDNLCLNDLARIIIFKFGSIKTFAQNMGWTRARGYQILKGYNPPKDIKIIKKMAELLNIDPIVLTEVLFRESKTHNPVMEDIK